MTLKRSSRLAEACDRTFAAGAADLLSAAVGWGAACAGGRDREGTGTRTAMYEGWHRPFSLRT